MLLQILQFARKAVTYPCYSFPAIGSLNERLTGIYFIRSWLNSWRTGADFQDSGFDSEGMTLKLYFFAKKFGLVIPAAYAPWFTLIIPAQQFSGLGLVFTLPSSSTVTPCVIT